MSVSCREHSPRFTSTSSGTGSPFWHPSRSRQASRTATARSAPEALEGAVDDEWGRRYGRQVRLGKNPARPKTRMNDAGADARRLLEHLAACYPALLGGGQAEALRQVVAQNYYWDPAGRLRWRDDDDGDAGLPPSAARVISPYDLAARYPRRGQVTRGWHGPYPTAAASPRPTSSTS